MASRSTVQGVDIRTRFERSLREHDLTRPGETVLLALSGGADSTALARLFASIAADWRLSLAGLHVNYALRGEDSEEDERFVRELAPRLGIRLAVRRTGPLGARRGESLQMAARRVRYALLEEEQERAAADRIATGHTRDDRIETLLLHLARGSGPRGLGAIPRKRGAIVRPLLDFGRDEIESFLDGIGAPFRIDRTNLERGYDRNKIRLDLLPHAEAILGRSLDRPLARAADILADIDSYLGAEANAWLSRQGDLGEPGGVLSVEASSLAALPRALAREVVRVLAERVAPAMPEPSFGRVEGTLRLASGAGGGDAALGSGCVVRREGDRLRFAPPGEEPAPFRANLPVPGEAALPGGGRVVARSFARSEAAGPLPEGGDRVWLDEERVRPPLVLRSRSAGDRFRPLGAPGEKKLQDLLVDRKVPRSARARVPILEDADGILWVVGLAIAERARVAPGTARILEVAFCGT